MITANDNTANERHQKRAIVLGAVLTFVAEQVGPVTYSAVLYGVMDHLGEPEEEVGGDVMHAAPILSRSGLLISSSLTGDVMTFGAETVVAASRLVTAFIHNDDYASSYDGPEAA